MNSKGGFLWVNVNPQTWFLTIGFFFVFSELKETVRKLEEWLKEAEVILKEPLRFNQKWTQDAIDAKKSEIQVNQTLFLIFAPKLWEVSFDFWRKIKVLNSGKRKAE